MAITTTPLDDDVRLQRCAGLYIRTNTLKGRGVFASEAIPAGTIVDTCSVLILDPAENSEHIAKTSLYHYTYNWPTESPPGGKPSQTQAVVLGLGSMFNHSTLDQNVGWKRDLDGRVVVYRALRDIAPGEELCISYGDRLTFVDADKPASNGTVESEDEHLGRIQLDT